MTTRLLMPSARTSSPSDRLFRNTAFLRLWAAQGLNQIGSRIQQTVLLWTIVAATFGHGGLTPASMVLVANTLPPVLIAPLAGKLADRVNKRYLMWPCALMQGILTWSLVAFAGAHGLDGWRMGLLYGGVLAIALMNAVFTPAAMAAVPEWVAGPVLFRANTLQEMTFQGAGLVGPPLGGILLALWGATPGFLIAGACLVASALVLGWPTWPRPIASETGALLETSLTPERLSLPMIRLVALLGILNFFTVPLLLFFPYMARSLFHTGAMGLGMLEGALSLGMVMATVILSLKQGFADVGQSVLLCFLAIGALYAFMGLWPTFVSSLLAVALIGGLISLVNVGVISTLQREIPGAGLGRAMGLLVAVTSAALPLSFWLYGPLADRFTPLPLLVMNGGAIALIAIGARPFLRPSNRLAEVDSTIESR